MSRRPDMKICVLEEAGPSEPLPREDQDWPTVILPYLDGHYCEVHGLEKKSSVERVTQLVGQGFDVFVNLCDGSWDSDSPGIEVVQTLERLNVPFTGASSSFYDPSRVEMKEICERLGIGFPSYVMAKSSSEVAQALSELEFPMIVKHPNGYSSWGLTKASRVEDAESLELQAAQAIDSFGRALVEEFIEGREFTVLVAEHPDDAANPVVYEPVEFRFPDGETFKHWDLKWKDFDGMTCVPCDDPALSERLKDVSRRMFLGLEGNGYGRCDIRVDTEGELFMLEINPNCGVFYDPEDAGAADFILLNDAQGHVGFVNLILRSAMNRVRVNEAT
ncbi:MAG: ATP-grasp domain-containing protein [Rhodothermales bacterium]|nr:ATP-grasp domain-containing protein [Rhodothermales bacterium]